MISNIYLRPLVRDDAKTSYKWRNNPKIWEYTAGAPDKYITEEIELNWIDKILQDNSTKRFAICLKEEDKYIGNIQLTNIVDECANLHIFIGDEKYWGNGLATEAMNILLEMAKNELNIKRIYLKVNPQNIYAVKLYKKAGFVELDDIINMQLEL